LTQPCAGSMVARMAHLELIELYPSPWSERARWALEWKRVPYARRVYQPLAGEEELRRTTGLSTVPVLLADGEVVGDSDAALDWLEEHHPSPALVPEDARLRAQVHAWEIAATETLGPAARLVMIGRWKARGMQPFADHFAAKYRWSPAEEARTARLLGALVADLAGAVAASPHLVGDGFTRADLTVACMVAGVIGIPPDGLFAVDESMRAMFGLLPDEDPAVAPLRAWRDGIYRRHRGRRVTPATGA
jgi:glutathione S-transferase